MSYLRNFNILTGDEAQENLSSFFSSVIVRREISGIFHWLPFGLLIRRNIENLIRQYMSQFGEEVSLSSLVSIETYKKSGRDSIFGEEIMKIENQPVVLSPTSEEVFFTSILANKESYKNYPKFFYQIGNKYRKEIRPRNILLRSIDFIMKDGYYMCSSQDENRIFYEKMKAAYREIFDKLDIYVEAYHADGGSMLSEYNEEFICLDDDIRETKTPEGKWGVEVGHVFDLGSVYSEKSGIVLMDRNNGFHKIFSSSFGIGISRLVYIIVKKLFQKQYVPSFILPFKIVCQESLMSNENILLIKDFIEEFGVMYSHKSVDQSAKVANMIGSKLVLIAINSKNKEFKFLNTVNNKHEVIIADKLYSYIRRIYR